LPGKCNFFVGSDPQRWRAGVSTFARVVYRGLYPGIDVAFRWNEGILEYDLHVAPGTDLHRLRIRCEGCGNLSIDPHGTLSVCTPEGGVLQQRRPLASQETSSKGSAQPVVNFVKQTTVAFGFEVVGTDEERPIVIDPGLDWSTYLGGTGP